MTQNLHGTVDFGEIAVGDHLRWLEANANLEASGAPVNELNGPFRLEGGDGSMNILGNNITTIQHASSHVLAVARITLDHLVVWLKARHGNFLNRVGLVCSLGSRHDWRVGDQRKVNAWIWHKIGLEFVEIDIERSIKAKRGGNRRDN